VGLTVRKCGACGKSNTINASACKFCGYDFSTPTAEICSACGKIIPNNETPRLVEDAVLCEVCFGAATATTSRSKSTRPPVAAELPDYSLPMARIPPPRKASRRPLAILGIIVLVLAGVTIGIVYKKPGASAPPLPNNLGPSSIRPDTLRSLDLYVAGLGSRAYEWRFRDLKPDNAAETDARRVRTGEEKSKEFDRWFTKESDLTPNEIAGIKQSKDQLVRLVTYLPGAYGDGNGYLANSPFHLISDRGQIFLTSADFGIDTVYNTLKSTARSRASKVLREHVFPRIAAMASCAKDLKTDGVAAEVWYYSRDFSKDYLNADSESILMVSTAADADSFAQKKMSEDEFLDKSRVYLNAEGNANLVKLKLE